MENKLTNRTAVQTEDFAECFTIIEKEVAKAIVGQKQIVRQLLTAMVAGGNVLLEGLPGLGKTQMVKAVSQSLGMKFSRIQFTPDLMPSDITGTDIIVKLPDGNSGFKFQKGPIFANLVLADEINRATPKTQSSLLEAMQEKTVTIGGITYKIEEPFFVLATQNPLEMEGTYPLPEAQMDRFMFKLEVDFPAKDELLRIIDITTKPSAEEPSKVFDGLVILELRRIAQEVPIASAVSEYAAELVLKTHPSYPSAPAEVKKYVRYGASPRGAQALISGARILALLDGRYNVSFDDINTLAFPSLRHRLFLNFEAMAEGLSADDILSYVIKQTNGDA